VCRRTGNRLPLRGFLLAATIAFGAALLVLLLLRFAPFGRSGKAPAYELILDPPLADHPLILQSGGADSFLEGIAGEIRAAGLGIDPTFRVAVSPELEAAFDPLRDQYDMDRVLGARSGARREPTPIVITGRHLFVEPFYTVLGRASNRGGVISTRWLDPVFLGEGESTEREAALFRRQLAKVLIHELGHARGLPHCDNRGCVMRSVEEAAEDFHRLDAVLCATCLERIRGAK
jgi:archaemetzincin